MKANFVQIDWGGVPFTVTTCASYICPDLLELDDIGAAGNVRGRVVRVFFMLMRFWKP